MRLTIKYLQEQLKGSEEWKKKYFDLWQELKNEKERSQYEFKIANNERTECLENEIRRLTQIIRILAKDPTLELEVKMRDEYRMT
jgi:gas vesicle protein